MQSLFSMRKEPLSGKITLLDKGSLLSAHRSWDYALCVSLLGLSIRLRLTGKPIDNKRHSMTTVEIRERM
jgi:hypothetical protein